MGKYNFDDVIDRKNTLSLKYDCHKRRNIREDAMSLWVADMDFKTPIEVREALKERVEHGIFGYSEPMESYFEAISNWMEKRHKTLLDKNKLVLAPSVVFALYNLVDLLTKEKDCILINQPVYYPFKGAIEENNRKVISSDLVYKDGYYTIDFWDLEKKIIDNDIKLYILCNPHNPVGRVWKREELEKISSICLKHNVFIISDEIHCDFIYKPHKFISFASLGSDARNNSIICTAPSKTFNLAGLHNANIYIENDKTRKDFKKILSKRGYSQSNIMGIIACEAAYSYGEEWLDELLVYLTQNISFVVECIKKNLPKVKVIIPEGTYLLWLDFNKYNLSDMDLNDIIINKCKLWLDSGSIFGKSGEGFQRINIAAPRSVIKECLDRLFNGFNDI